jgi:hypothetical protein
MGPSYSRKYNTLLVAATAIYLPMVKRGVVDFALGADWTPAAGDVKVSIDGGAAANIINLPTAIAMGNTAMWQFILTAAELTGKHIVVTVADSATKAVEDQMFSVETFGNASALFAADLAAANLPANVAAVAGTTQTAGDLAALLATIAGYIDTEVAAIKTQTDQLGFTSGRLNANVAAVNGSTASVAALESGHKSTVVGTVGSGSTTTNIVTSSLAPAAVTADQFIGRIVTFALDTSTAALRGQATNITASTSGGALTVTALTHAPSSGDTFSIT